MELYFVFFPIATNLPVDRQVFHPYGMRNKNPVRDEIFVERITEAPIKSRMDDIWKSNIEFL